MEQNNKKNSSIFAAAVATEIDSNGEKVYIPCIFSVEEQRIIWAANLCNKYFDKALITANIATELLERDFARYIITGQKSKELLELLHKLGDFEVNCDDEEICKMCRRYEECKKQKENHKDMN